MNKFTLKSKKKKTRVSNANKSRKSIKKNKKGGVSDEDYLVKRKLHFGLEYQDNDESEPTDTYFVMQSEDKKGNLTKKRWNCGCKQENDDLNDLEYKCDCDVLDEGEDKTAYGEWNIPDRVVEGKVEDEYDEELERLKDEWDRCHESGFNNAIECRRVRIKLKAKERQMKGGGIEKTKKTKLTEIKSLIEVYKNAIKEYYKTSKKVSKDKSLKKSTKVSKNKSKKSKKLSMKKSKKYSKK